ncbi:MAG: cytochrome c biogenesis CcdA family protein [Fidelibacterota bacterium]
MTELLLLSAAVLGLLAFFEPCTIATHTLFAVRAHQNPGHRLSALFTLFFSRVLLLITLLVIAVALAPAIRWMPALPGIILLFLAAVYIVSRFTYVPIPHLAFTKLLPSSRTQNPDVQLGLTLPACTIPLFAVILGLSMTVDSLPLAALAGLTFATFFTLPTAIIMVRGVSTKGQTFLEYSSRITPFLTAFLFIAAAVFSFAPVIDISLPTLKLILREPNFTGIALGFVAGLVFSFNPVSFTAIPVMLAYVTKARSKRRTLALGLAFVAGMIATHVTLGVASALGGGWMQNIMGRFWGLILGPVLIVLGLMWPGWLNIRLPWFGLKGRPVTGLGSAFLLGIPFSIAVCPFCSPALLVMLTASATTSSVPFGFFMLLSFALGRSIPVLIGAWSMGWLESMNIIGRYQNIIEIIAGIVLIASGIYFLNEFFMFV